MKQILKKWRVLPPDKKAPFLTQAKENRNKLQRMRKTHQVYMHLFNKRVAYNEIHTRSLKELRMRQCVHNSRHEMQLIRIY